MKCATKYVRYTHTHTSPSLEGIRDTKHYATKNDPTFHAGSAATPFDFKNFVVAILVISKDQLGFFIYFRLTIHTSVMHITISKKIAKNRSNSKQRRHIS